MLTATHLRACAAATTGLLLGGLSIAAAVTVVTAPLTPRLAVAETVKSATAQPTVAARPAGPGLSKH